MFTRPKSTWILCVLLTILLSVALFSPAAAAPPKASLGLFWKVPSPTSAIYLLGSIHLGTKEMYPLTDYMEKAFARSSVLIVEVNLNKVDKAEQEKIGQYVAANGTYTGNDTLWQHVSKTTKAKVQAFCSANSIPPEAFAKMKPWLLAITVAILPLQKAGMDAALGIDKYFLDKAKDTKPVDQLETAEGQIRLLSDVPTALEENYLSVSLEQASKYQELAKTMQSAWMDGDAAKMDAFLSRWFSQPAAMARKLREDRNPHMAEVAESYLREC